MCDNADEGMVGFISAMFGIGGPVFADEFLCLPGGLFLPRSTWYLELFDRSVASFNEAFFVIFLDYIFRSILLSVRSVESHTILSSSS